MGSRGDSFLMHKECAPGKGSVRADEQAQLRFQPRKHLSCVGAVGDELPGCWRQGQRLGSLSVRPTTQGPAPPALPGVSRDLANLPPKQAAAIWGHCALFQIPRNQRDTGDSANASDPLATWKPGFQSCVSWKSPLALSHSRLLTPQARRQQPQQPRPSHQQALWATKHLPSAGRAHISSLVPHHW